MVGTNFRHSSNEPEKHMEKSRITKRVIAPFVRIVRKKKHADEDEREDIKKPDEILRNLSAFLLDSYELSVSLYESCEVLKEITNASSFTLYLADPSSNEIYESRKAPIKERYRVKWKIEKGTIVAAYVAHTKTYVMIDDILLDDRFPEGIGYEGDTAKSVLSVPIISPQNDCFAVLEFYRNIFNPPFMACDLEIVAMTAGWMGIAIAENQQSLALQRQQDLNNYLSDLTKYYFEDSDVLEKMTKEIIRNVKDTLQAERAAVYILDKENDEELVADLFEETKCGQIEKLTRVKFGKERVIAGIVAKSGEIINLKDAYMDVFRQTDGANKAGFIIRSILCIPIMGNGVILGVLQAANKSNGGYFTATDEHLMKTFTDFQALVLYCTQITTLRSEKSLMTSCYKQWMSMAYVPCIHDVVNFEKNRDFCLGRAAREFMWCHSPHEVDILPQICYQLYLTVLPEIELNLNNLVRFILTVRKFYNTPSYHNFENAVNRFHCVCTIIRKNPANFKKIEIKALLVAALCQDVDHYGLSSNYLTLVHDDLAQLYDYSILENHHYQITMLLLNSYKIYHNLNDHETQIMNNEIKKAIISTDLACYSNTALKLQSLIDTRSLNWINDEHRELIKSLMMITSVLCHNCKSFMVAKKTTRSLCEELFNEGDLVNGVKLCPLSQLNRNEEQMIPENQVNFLTFMVIPCMKLLKDIFPNTKELFEGALHLRQAWKDIIDVRGKKCWRQDTSFVRK